MVQVLPQLQQQRKKSFMEQIGGGVGNALGSFAEYKQMQQEREAENEAVKQQYGIDLTGISDPKQRAQAFQMAMQDQYSQQEQARKLSGQKELLEQEYGLKQGIAKGKQDFLGGLFGNQNGQNQQGIGQEADINQSNVGGLNAASLTDEDIARATAMDPNLGRALGHAKDVALREKRSEREFQLQKQKASPDYQRQQKLEAAQATSDVKYNQELQAAAKQHEIKTQTLNKLEALNKKGVTGKAYEKVLEKFGLIALTSDGRREFAADVKNLITDIRSILGGQFSTFEFQTILNAYPSADFSKGANAAIIKNLQEFQDIRNKEFEIAKEIKKENKGKVPFDFQSMVNERLDEYAQSRLPEIKENTKKIMAEEYGIPAGRVLMFDPNGEPLNVSPQEVDHYIELGASLP